MARITVKRLVNRSPGHHPKPKIRALKYRSLFLFGPDNKFRQMVMKIIRSLAFEILILLAIIASCVVAGINNSKKTPLGSPWTMMDMALNFSFLIEFALKAVVYGLVLHPGSYLRDPLNVLDSVVVVSGVISSIVILSGQEMFNVNTIRLFRVLRPIRLLVATKELRIVMETILRAFVSLMNVTIFIAFILLLFAVIGLELFSGKLHHACYNGTTHIIGSPLRVCKGSNDMTSCRFGQVCLGKWSGPNKGLGTFDNIAYAIITVFQIVTLEDWAKLFYKVNDATSDRWPWIFFLSIILLGAYFSMDLYLGIITNEYVKTKTFINNKWRKRKNRIILRVHAKLKGMLQIMTYVKSNSTAAKEEEINPGLSTTRHPTDLNSIEEQIEVIKVEPETQVEVAEDTLKISVISKVNKYIKCLVHEKRFFWTVMILIALNTICLSVDNQAFSKNVKDKLDIAYLVFNVLFVIELSIKLWGYGIQQYFQGRFRTFDFIVVAASVVELIVSLSRGRRITGLSIIRSMLLIRVFKFTRFWPAMKAVNRSFIRSARAISSLLIVLLIVLFIYALLGNQMFKEYVKKDGALTELAGSFDNLGDSMLLVFTLLTGEGWTSLMAEISEGYAGEKAYKKIFPVIFLLTFILIGSFILMNIFLGIVIDNLTTDLEEAQSDTKDDAEKEGMDGNCTENEAVCKHEANIVKTDVKIVVQESSADDTDHDEDRSSDVIKLDSNVKDGNGRRVKFDESSFVDVSLHSDSEDDNPRTNSSRDTRRMSNIRRLSVHLDNLVETKVLPATRTISTLVDPKINVPIPQHNSLYVFSPENALRIFCYKTVTSIWFPPISLGAIIISSLLLAVEDPLKRDATLSKSLKYIDHAFTGLFSVEIVLKIITYGFVIGHRSCFLRDPLNAMDITVVLLSIINAILEATNQDVPLQLRVLRILRVFRAFKISKQLKHVVNCLVAAFRKIVNYFFFYILLLFVYAVVGMKLYSGKLGSCKGNPNATTYNSCKGMINITGKLSNVKWENEASNFNNVGGSMITLFGIGTLDAWPVDLKAMMKVNGINANVSILFVVSFIIVMSFLMLNVFVGFVVVAFHNERDRKDGYKVLKKPSQDCMLEALTITLPNSTQPERKWKKAIWKLITSSWFEYGVLSCVALNTVIIITRHHNQSVAFTKLQDIGNLVFTTLFTIESGLKLAGFGPRGFVKDYWCVFDGLVVIGSWTDIILSQFKITFINLTLLRLFRVARVLKLVSKHGNLKQLLSTFIKSLKSIPSIALLLGMVFFVYGVLGMQMFGRIKLDPTKALNRNVNFQSFPQALLLLLRVTTLDAWRELMDACADTTSMNCINDPNKNCGSQMSHPFFISFIFMSSFMVTNLFLAVIMDNFMYLTLDPSVLVSKHVSMFATIWRKFDPNNTGKIYIENITDLLRKIHPPMGFGKFCPKGMIYGKLVSMNIPINEDGTVGFRELLMTLVIRGLDLDLTGNNSKLLKDDIVTLCPKADMLPLTQILQGKSRTPNNLEKHFRATWASNTIKYHMKNFVARLKRDRLETVSDSDISSDNGETQMSKESLGSGSYEVPIDGLQSESSACKEDGIQATYPPSGFPILRVYCDDGSDFSSTNDSRSFQSFPDCGISELPIVLSDDKSAYVESSESENSTLYASSFEALCPRDNSSELHSGYELERGPETVQETWNGNSEISNSKSCDSVWEHDRAKEEAKDEELELLGELIKDLVTVDSLANTQMEKVTVKESEITAVVIKDALSPFPTSEDVVTDSVDHEIQKTQSLVSDAQDIGNVHGWIEENVCNSVNQEDSSSKKVHKSRKTETAAELESDRQTEMHILQGKVGNKGNLSHSLSVPNLPTSLSSNLFDHLKRSLEKWEEQNIPSIVPTQSKEEGKRWEFSPQLLPKWHQRVRERRLSTSRFAPYIIPFSRSFPAATLKKENIVELIHNYQFKCQSASVPREEIIMKESDNEDQSRVVRICSEPECIQEICDMIGATGGESMNEIDSFHEDVPKIKKCSEPECFQETSEKICATSSKPSEINASLEVIEDDISDHPAANEVTIKACQEPLHQLDGQECTRHVCEVQFQPQQVRSIVLHVPEAPPDSEDIDDLSMTTVKESKVDTQEKLAKYFYSFKSLDSPIAPQKTLKYESSSEEESSQTKKVEHVKKKRKKRCRRASIIDPALVNEACIHTKSTDIQDSMTQISNDHEDSELSSEMQGDVRKQPGHEAKQTSDTKEMSPGSAWKKGEESCSAIGNIQKEVKEQAMTGVNFVVQEEDLEQLLHIPNQATSNEGEEKSIFVGASLTQEDAREQTLATASSAGSSSEKESSQTKKVEHVIKKRKKRSRRASSIDPALVNEACIQPQLNYFQESVPQIRNDHANSELSSKMLADGSEQPDDETKQTGDTRETPHSLASKEGEESYIAIGKLQNNIEKQTTADANSALQGELDQLLHNPRPATSSSGKEKPIFVGASLTQEDAKEQTLSSPHSAGREDTQQEFVIASSSIKMDPPNEPLLIRSSIAQSSCVEQLSTGATGAPSNTHVIGKQQAVFDATASGGQKGAEVSSIQGLPNLGCAKSSNQQIRAKNVSMEESLGEQYKASECLQTTFIDPYLREDFIIQLYEKNVSLYKTSVHMNRNLSGNILIPFSQLEKDVIVTYTTNEWRTCSEMLADSEGRSSDYDNFEIFSFTIFVPERQCAEFSIKCQSKDEVFWDNNNGENYKTTNVIVEKQAAVTECVLDGTDIVDLKKCAEDQQNQSTAETESVVNSRKLYEKARNKEPGQKSCEPVYEDVTEHSSKKQETNMVSIKSGLPSQRKKSKRNILQPIRMKRSTMELAGNSIVKASGKTMKDQYCSPEEKSEKIKTHKVKLNSKSCSSVSHLPASSNIDFHSGARPRTKSVQEMTRKGQYDLLQEKERGNMKHQVRLKSTSSFNSGSLAKYSNEDLRRSGAIPKSETARKRSSGNITTASVFSINSLPSMHRVRSSRVPLPLLDISSKEIMEEEQHPTERLRLAFLEPFIRDDYDDILRIKGVSLYHVKIEMYRYLTGTVHVPFCKQDKEVIIRYTLDNWLSYYDVVADADGTSPDSDDAHRFCFTLFIPKGHDMEFAVMCHVNGNAFWDDNDGDNYKIISEMVVSEIKEEDPTPIESSLDCDLFPSTSVGGRIDPELTRAAEKRYFKKMGEVLSNPELTAKLIPSEQETGWSDEDFASIFDENDIVMGQRSIEQELNAIEGERQRSDRGLEVESMIQEARISEVSKTPVTIRSDHVLNSFEAKVSSSISPQEMHECMSGHTDDNLERKSVSVADLENVPRTRSSVLPVPYLDFNYEDIFEEQEEPIELLQTTFTDPFLQENFKELLQKRKVILNTTLVEMNRYLSGTIRILGIGKEIEVLVRYTIDDWKTYSDLIADCQGRLLDQDNIETFSFTIFVPKGHSLEFGIRGQIDHEVYWDNNDGKNYKAINQVIKRELTESKSYFSQDSYSSISLCDRIIPELARAEEECYFEKMKEALSSPEMKPSISHLSLYTVSEILKPDTVLARSGLNINEVTCQDPTTDEHSMETSDISVNKNVKCHILELSNSVSTVLSKSDEGRIPGLKPSTSHTCLTATSSPEPEESRISLPEEHGQKTSTSSLEPEAPVDFQEANATHDREICTSDLQDPGKSPIQKTAQRSSQANEHSSLTSSANLTTPSDISETKEGHLKLSEDDDNTVVTEQRTQATEQKAIMTEHIPAPKQSSIEAGNLNGINSSDMVYLGHSLSQNAVVVEDYLLPTKSSLEQVSVVNVAENLERHTDSGDIEIKLQQESKKQLVIDQLALEATDVPDEMIYLRHSLSQNTVMEENHPSQSDPGNDPTGLAKIQDHLKENTTLLNMETENQHGSSKQTVAERLFMEATDENNNKIQHCISQDAIIEIIQEEYCTCQEINNRHQEAQEQLAVEAAHENSNKIKQCISQKKTTKLIQEEDGAYQVNNGHQDAHEQPSMETTDKNSNKSINFIRQDTTLTIIQEDRTNQEVNTGCEEAHQQLSTESTDEKKNKTEKCINQDMTSSIIKEDCAYQDVNTGHEKVQGQLSMEDTNENSNQAINCISEDMTIENIQQDGTYQEVDTIYKEAHKHPSMESTDENNNKTGNYISQDTTKKTMQEDLTCQKINTEHKEAQEHHSVESTDKDINKTKHCESQDTTTKVLQEKDCPFQEGSNEHEKAQELVDHETVCKQAFETANEVLSCSEVNNKDQSNSQALPELENEMLVSAEFTNDTQGKSRKQKKLEKKRKKRKVGKEHIATEKERDVNKSKDSEPGKPLTNQTLTSNEQHSVKATDENSNHAINCISEYMTIENIQQDGTYQEVDTIYKETHKQISMESTDENNNMIIPCIRQDTNTTSMQDFICEEVNTEHKKAQEHHSIESTDKNNNKTKHGESQDTTTKVLKEEDCPYQEGSTEHEEAQELVKTVCKQAFEAANEVLSCSGVDMKDQSNSQALSELENEMSVSAEFMNDTQGKSRKQKKLEKKRKKRKAGKEHTATEKETDYNVNKSKDSGPGKPLTNQTQTSNEQHSVKANDENSNQAINCISEDMTTENIQQDGTYQDVDTIYKEAHQQLSNESTDENNNKIKTCIRQDTNTKSMQDFVCEEVHTKHKKAQERHSVESTDKDINKTKHCESQDTTTKVSKEEDCPYQEGSTEHEEAQELVETVCKQAFETANEVLSCSGVDIKDQSNSQALLEHENEMSVSAEFTNDTQGKSRKQKKLEKKRKKRKAGKEHIATQKETTDHNAKKGNDNEQGKPYTNKTWTSNEEGKARAESKPKEHKSSTACNISANTNSGSTDASANIPSDNGCKSTNLSETVDTIDMNDHNERFTEGLGAAPESKRKQFKDADGNIVDSQDHGGLSLKGPTQHLIGNDTKQLSSGENVNDDTEKSTGQPSMRETQKNKGDPKSEERSKSDTVITINTKQSAKNCKSDTMTISNKNTSWPLEDGSSYNLTDQEKKRSSAHDLSVQEKKSSLCGIIHDDSNKEIHLQYEPYAISVIKKDPTRQTMQSVSNKDISILALRRSVLEASVKDACETDTDETQASSNKTDKDISILALRRSVLEASVKDACETDTGETQASSNKTDKFSSANTVCRETIDMDNCPVASIESVKKRKLANAQNSIEKARDSSLPRHKRKGRQKLKKPVSGNGNKKGDGSPESDKATGRSEGTSSKKKKSKKKKTEGNNVSTTEESNNHLDSAAFNSFTSVAEVLKPTPVHLPDLVPVKSSCIQLPINDISCDEMIENSNRNPEYLIACFTLPIMLSDFQNRINRQHISLHSVCIMNRYVAGIVSVKHDPRQTDVILRYTVDDWYMYSDLEAEFLLTYPEAQIDHYSFTIYVPQGKSAKFAVRYSTPDDNHWDNNGGRNYKVANTTASIQSQDENSPQDTSVDDNSSTMVTGASSSTSSSTMYHRPKGNEDIEDGMLSSAYSSQTMVILKNSVERVQHVWCTQSKVLDKHGDTSLEKQDIATSCEGKPMKEFICSGPGSQKSVIIVPQTDDEVGYFGLPIPSSSGTDVTTLQGLSTIKSSIIKLPYENRDNWETLEAEFKTSEYLVACFPNQLMNRATRHRIHNKMILLQSVCIMRRYVTGIVCVRRRKKGKVIVRYTTDDWQSHKDLQAEYILSPYVDGIEKYSFNMLVPSGCGIEFALRYRVGGKLFWDSNDGQNYKLVNLTPSNEMLEYLDWL